MKTKLTPSEKLAKQRAALRRSEERVAKTVDPTVTKLRTIQKQLVALDYNEIAEDVEREIKLAVSAALVDEKAALAEATGDPDFEIDEDDDEDPFATEPVR